jgi:hypothetical protein
MNLQQQLREAIIDELRRQADISRARLTVEARGEQIIVNGPVNLSTSS